MGSRWKSGKEDEEEERTKNNTRSKNISTKNGDRLQKRRSLNRLSCCVLFTLVTKLELVQEYSHAQSQMLMTVRNYRALTCLHTRELEDANRLLRNRKFVLVQENFSKTRQIAMETADDSNLVLFLH